MTWDFWTTYTDENYAVLSRDWIERSGQAPSTFNLQRLQADLSHL